MTEELRIIVNRVRVAATQATGLVEIQVSDALRLCDELNETDALLVSLQANEWDATKGATP